MEAARNLRGPTKGNLMISVHEAASAFLANKRIAVTGVSRDAAGHGSNAVFKRLRERGYEVFAVNPNADQVEGERSYHTLREIPGGVDAVVIGTRPDHAEATMHDCADLGVEQVWMHRAFGEGSVCHAATVYGREHGITVIDGGCPLMFEPTADVGHKILRFVFTRTGKVPSAV
jgi:predicted CoA-binding protein